MNKPVYLGILKLYTSKTVIYEFWYDYVKPNLVPSASFHHYNKVKEQLKHVMKFYTNREHIFQNNLTECVDGNNENISTFTVECTVPKVKTK